MNEKRYGRRFGKGFLLFLARKAEECIQKLRSVQALLSFLHKKAQDATPPALPEGTVRRRYSIEGQVQGVGFRYRARYAAQTLELTGWVENEDDGSVTLEVQGDPDKFMRLFAMIQKSDYIRITGIRQKVLPPDPWERGFSVRGY